MTKTILLMFTLLTCTAWMVAQSTSPPSGSNQTGQTGSENDQATSGQMSGSNHTTIRGCLHSSGEGYTLTDAAGTQYQLAGDTSKLSAHVNNEVEVRGSASGSSGSSAGSQTAAGSAAAGQMFSVTKIKKLSSNCSTSK